MHLSVLDQVLWLASLLGHVTLAFVLVQKRRYLGFPVLFGFLIFSVLRSVLLFGVLRYGSRHAYFLAYWISGLADYLFQVAIIYEVARSALRPTGRWILDARRSFFAWSAVWLLTAALFASRIGPPQSKGLDLWGTQITVFTALMTCGLFLAMSFSANRLGLRRRSYVIAIGQGLFLWSLSGLLEDIGHTIFGWNRDFTVLEHIGMFVYLGVLAYWTIVFWRPEVERGALSPEIRDYLLAAHARLAYDSSSPDPL